jgi:CubicO group peptidase (beta-lactamase class C family)
LNNIDSNRPITFPTARWEESNPHEHGMQEEFLQLAHRKILKELPNIYSLLVIRNGAIVFERYYQGHGPSSLFDVRSVTKSFISALIGIALTETNILNLDQTILSYFPEYKANNMDPRKAAITIKDLLTMKSGIAWDEDDEFERLSLSDNWIQYIFSRPMADDPGNVFNYNSGASHILSELIRKVTGMDVLEFAQQRLFPPLGIRRAHWQTDPMGIPFGFAGLSLTARDLAKLGLLYLMQGMWNKTQILTPDYVHASTRTWSSGGFPEDSDYGYHWWVLPSESYPAFFAAGYGGQYLWVVPDLDLIVITTAEPWLPAALIQDHRFLITDFIVPAVLPNMP